MKWVSPVQRDTVKQRSHLLAPKDVEYFVTNYSSHMHIFLKAPRPTNLGGPPPPSLPAAAVLQTSQLHASRGDPASSRPTRIPPRFGRSGTRSPPPSTKIGGMEFDSSNNSGGSGGSGRRGTLFPSAPPPPVRAAVSDTALDDFGGSGRAPLQDRLQAAPTYLREKAVDLREDARYRVQDIRVRYIHRRTLFRCLVWRLHESVSYGRFFG